MKWDVVSSDDVTETPHCETHIKQESLKNHPTKPRPHYPPPLCLPSVRTSSRKTVLSPCMQGLFNYFCKVHSICRIVLLLACSAPSVLFHHRMNDTTYCILITPRAASLAEGERRAVIHHARHEAAFLSNTFSPTGSLHSTSLIHFLNLLEVFIYIFYSQGAR